MRFEGKIAECGWFVALKKGGWCLINGNRISDIYITDRTRAESRGGTAEVQGVVAAVVCVGGVTLENSVSLLDGVELFCNSSGVGC